MIQSFDQEIGIKLSHEMGTWCPTVTIVIPAYNSEETIGRCLSALLSQGYPLESYKIIIVDNNSSDNTTAIVEGFPVELAFERSIQTSYAARNKGISLAKSEIIAFLDSDCIPMEDWLVRIVQPFCDPSVGVVGGKRESLAPESDATLVERFLAKVHCHNEHLYDPSEPYGFPTANVAYRSKAIERVGVFDASMPGGGDVDLAWRVQVFGGYKGVYNPEAVVFHKHCVTLQDHYRQFRRYGFSEMVLSTLYRSQLFPRRTPINQTKVMLRQMKSLGIYIFSFTIRFLRINRWKSDRLYLASPLLCFVMDFGNLVGKIHGIVKTRFFQRNPYENQYQVIQRSSF